MSQKSEELKFKLNAFRIKDFYYNSKLNKVKTENSLQLPKILQKDDMPIVVRQYSN